MTVKQNYVPALANVDSYKLSHYQFSPEGLTEIYSNLAVRFCKYFKDKYPDFDNMFVTFGQQYVIKTIHNVFEEFFKNDIEHEIESMKKVFSPAFGMENYDHFRELHKLGYLPIEYKSLPEGLLVEVGTPILTVKNTHPDFAWLTNYLENIISIETWKPLTVATIARQFRNLSEEFAEKTCDDNSHVNFQNHDFSQRGQAGRTNNSICGVAWLTHSVGTDNVPAIYEAYNSYNGSTAKTIGLSIPASEHSVATLGIQLSVNKNGYTGKNSLVNGERDFLKDCLVNKFPKGMFSFVFDSYDYWEGMKSILPALKTEIMNRDGRLVIRPDSGDPVEIVCGTYSYEVYETLDDAIKDSEHKADSDLREELSNGEYCSEITYNVYVSSEKQYYTISVGCSVIRERGGYSDNNYYVIDEIFDAEANKIELTNEQKGSIEVLWDIFGGHVNEKGYKVLDPHIGLIYGDGITYHRAKEILSRLEKKGFASSNVVFGIGSYSLNLLSRDDLGIAIKATHAVVDGEDIDLYKDPKTDSSKKSLRGYLKAVEENGSIKINYPVTREEESSEDNMFKLIYRNGEFFNETSLQEIRDRLKIDIDYS